MWASKEQVIGPERRTGYELERPVSGALSGERIVLLVRVFTKRELIDHHPPCWTKWPGTEAHTIDEIAAESIEVIP